MKPRTLLLGLIGAWLFVEVLLYWWLVPSVLAMTNFLWISIVLFMLIVVMVAKWRGSGFDDSIATVLYNAEHRAGSGKA